MQTIHHSPKNKIVLLTLCALLSALSILFGKYFAINPTESIRISFENLPILMAGLFLGPTAGATVGAVADLVGCLMVGYSINPMITLGSVLIGLLAGLVGSFRQKCSFPLVLIAVLLSHLVGSVLTKTMGLVIYYDLPFWVTLGWRIVSYALISVAEIAILTLLGKHKGFMDRLHKILHR